MIHGREEHDTGLWETREGNGMEEMKGMGLLLSIIDAFFSGLN